MDFITDISILTMCPVPPTTDTYTAVPHIDIHNKILEVLESKGIEILQAQFKSNRKGTQVIVTYTLDLGDNEFGGMIAFRNSYDKTRSVAICCGSVVYICSNGSIMGEMRFLRRHVGKVDELLEEAIEEQLGKVENMIDQTRQLKNDLDQVDCPLYRAAEIVGLLYFSGVLTTTQLEIIKSEIQSPSYVYGTNESSLWALFNHVTHSLKKSAVSNYFEDHLSVLNMFKNYAQ